MEVVRSLAMPRTHTTVTSTQASRIRSMINAGRTYAEVAEAIGVPPSTVKEVVTA